MTYHVPVLLHEVMEYLKVCSGGLYIDATLGGGGHTKEILKKGGVVLGIDTDEDALAYVSKELESYIANRQLTIAKGNFKDLSVIALENGFKSVHGILFDFGVSSHQLDSKERGFSFLREAPLDMRMGKDLGVTAADLVNVLPKKELQRLFSEYGEEPYSGRIASKIVEERKKKKIETTVELALIIEELVGRVDGINPATKVFQALRIAVNDELGSIREVLPKACDLLDTQGRLVAISFHSLEDRIVKDFFKKFEREDKGKMLNEKIVMAQEIEVQHNPRSRSAKLRAFEKK